MNVDAELDRMKQAIFTEELLTKLLSCSQKTLDAQGSTVPPGEAQAARAALEDLLTPQQKQILAALEEKHRDILRRLLPFAVQQGLCAGFQQYFSNDPLTPPPARPGHPKGAGSNRPLHRLHLGLPAGHRPV